MTRAVDLAHYDPADRATQQDPHPWYAALRREAPVHYHEASGLYMVSTMKAVLEVLAQLWEAERAGADAAGAARQVFAGQFVVRAIWQSSIPDPRNIRVF